MAEIINGISVPFKPIVNNDFAPSVNRKSTEVFSDIFKSELDKIKFSAHALKRLESRNIQMDDLTMDKLTSAVEKAEAKGAKDSLVMLDDTAFIVNIANRTVVTTMPVKENDDKVFTNIDSVVFA
ncbi:MAG: flagellar protein [Chlorobiaceae bacterium]|nr:flagellar protein [Chlorobiaceae bacterium]